VLNGTKLKKVKDKTSFDSQSLGWYFDPTDHKGIVHIKTNKLNTNNQATVLLML
jgi:hypothetical protein